MVNKITLVIPTYNNLQHIKNAYTSIRKWYPTLDLVLLDDGSNDGTYEWLLETKSSDENIVLHRNKKIIQNFGLDFDDLNIEGFEEFVKKVQIEYEGKTTKGMFAPWILYKEDFQRIGGHDPLFAPFPYEDSDIFQRWIMARYELIQSRDSFVYHLTCRGHRWNDQIQKDDDYYKVASQKAARNYLRKWGSWIEIDSYQYPIITPKYDIGFIIKNCNLDLLKVLEPWCSTVYTDELFEIGRYQDYIEMEQNNTLFDLDERIKPYDNEKNNEILVEIDGKNLTNDDFKIIQQLAKIIQDSGEVGKFTLGNLNIEIVQMNEYQNTLINVDR